MLIDADLAASAKLSAVPASASVTGTSAGGGAAATGVAGAGFGSNPSIVSFIGSRVTVMILPIHKVSIYDLALPLQVTRADGATVFATASVYAPPLYEFAVRSSNLQPLLQMHDYVLMQSTSRWDKAVRLARFVNSPQLWAALAGLALAGNYRRPPFVDRYTTKPSAVCRTSFGHGRDGTGRLHRRGQARVCHSLKKATATRIAERRYVILTLRP
jgi:hypothetical protein